MPMFKERLIALKKEQANYRKLCGNSYCTDYIGYININEVGNLLTPEYVSRRFQLILANNGLKKIRFHDLRHSCASLLLANGVSMKEIQDWLGHSDFSTTANLYSHLDYSSKVSSAQMIVTALENDRR